LTKDIRRAAPDRLGAGAASFNKVTGRQTACVLTKPT
jgi:hypothetical protein